MANRITDRDLDGLCRTLNKLTGSPEEGWSTDENGKNKANVGHHYISSAYGGVCLHQIVNDGGGVRCPLIDYHVPKRELYTRMHSYMDGIDAGRRIGKAEAEIREAYEEGWSDGRNTTSVTGDPSDDWAKSDAFKREKAS